MNHLVHGLIHSRSPPHGGHPGSFQVESFPGCWGTMIPPFVHCFYVYFVLTVWLSNVFHILYCLGIVEAVGHRGRSWAKTWWRRQHNTFVRSPLSFSIFCRFLYLVVCFCWCFCGQVERFEVAGVQSFVLVTVSASAGRGQRAWEFRTFCEGTKTLHLYLKYFV